MYEMSILGSEKNGDHDGLGLKERARFHFSDKQLTGPNCPRLRNNNTLNIFKKIKLIHILLRNIYGPALYIY